MSKFLRRYTELPFLLYLLKTKQITLLNPKLWDDKNDSHHIEAYRVQKSLGSVLALCLTEAPETYHHWKVFSGGTAGVCIVFDKERFLNWARNEPCLHAGPVTYRTMNSVRTTAPDLEELPFLKRYAFRDEKEYRLIFKENDGAHQFKDIKIDLATISKIVVSPWLPKSVFSSVKTMVQSIDGCKSIRALRTTLVDNEEWKRIGSNSKA